MLCQSLLHPRDDVFVMPSEQDIQKGLEVFGPDSVTIDGHTVKNRSVDDLRKAAELAKGPVKPFSKIAISQFVSSGAVQRVRSQ